MVWVAVYAIWISYIYRFMGRRDIVELNLHKYETSKNRIPRTLLHLIFYAGKYLVLFPIVAFAWFTILFVLFIFLAKTHSLDPRLLVSMAGSTAMRFIAFLLVPVSGPSENPALSLVGSVLYRHILLLEPSPDANFAAYFSADRQRRLLHGSHQWT